MSIFNFQNKPVFLAPMAGYTDLPFRLFSKKFGADVVTTEMVSAKGLYYGDQKTAKLLATDAEEAPAGAQIFGNDPDIISWVIEEKLNGTAFDFIDFNAGCPAPKIVKNHDGSALLKDLGRLSDIVKAMTDASIKPVTVKLRLGWDAEHIVVDEAVKRIEDAGAAAVFIHGRTREMFYSGKADWDAIARVKAEVSIPVILNGDITCGADALRAFEQTGCDGIMIGRAAVGNPFIFREVKAALLGKPYQPASDAEKLTAAIDHLESVRMTSDHPAAIRAMRKQLVAYTKGIPGSAALRTAIFKEEDGQKLVDLLKKHRDNLSS
ncbi:MAG: tRNA dihydrouridine synthase DusB [Eubacteriaceae bacterium]|nr:tRNA dihydrouridine synthase DusB [Eubacteriaceae bacterium]